jgi:hypothetical protein
MTLHRISKLVAITTVGALGLVACGSSGDEASSQVVDRQAALFPLGTEICVSRDASAGPMTVTFRNSANSIGNGPFSLDYIQCGETKNSATPEVLRLDVADSNDTAVLYMGAGNPEIGYPKMTVKYLIDGKSDTHSFNVGETFTYNVGPYSVKVERRPDTDTAKSLYAVVSRQ